MILQWDINNHILNVAQFTCCERIDCSWIAEMWFVIFIHLSNEIRCDWIFVIQVLAWNAHLHTCNYIYWVSTQWQVGGRQIFNSAQLWQMMEQYASIFSSARDQDFFTPLGKRVTNYALAICTGLHWKPHTSICSPADNYYCLKPVEFRTIGVWRFIIVRHSATSKQEC